MSALIPFDQAGKNLPAYLKAVAPAESNALAAHHTVGFPVLSIKGKTWTIVRGGEKFIIPNPKDPESPATYVEVVIIKASSVKNKVWYAGSYVEGAEAGKPECFSTDGVKPDSTSETPQAKSCAACKHNQWGSKISTDGKPSKGKACNDTIRLAVSTQTALNDPHLLRIPPASIKAAGEYGEMLRKRGVPLEAVVTRLKFNPEAPTPQIEFSPVGFLSEAEYATVQEIAAEEVVTNILGVAGYVAEGEMAAQEAAPAAAKPAAKTAAQIEEEAEEAALQAMLAKKAAKAQAALDAAAEAAAARDAAAAAKTPEELEAEAEEAAMAELLAKKAARTAAAAITTAKVVTPAEVVAAIEAGEADQPVVAAARAAPKPRKAPAPKVEEAAPADGLLTAIEIDGIPDLSTINFDD